MLANSFANSFANFKIRIRFYYYQQPISFHTLLFASPLHACVSLFIHPPPSILHTCTYTYTPTHPHPHTPTHTHPCTHTHTPAHQPGGPDRWRIIDIAAGGRHSLVLAVPDNGNLKKSISSASVSAASGDGGGMYRWQPHTPLTAAVSVDDGDTGGLLRGG